MCCLLCIYLFALGNLGLPTDFVGVEGAFGAFGLVAVFVPVAVGIVVISAALRAVEAVVVAAFYVGVATVGLVAGLVVELVGLVVGNSLCAVVGEDLLGLV